MWQLKNTLADTEISTFFNVCVLATISDVSFQPCLTGQGTPALPEVFGHIHRQFSTQGDFHANTRTQALIHTFPRRYNPLSIQGKEIYLYRCNDIFSVKYHFSNVHRQLTGTGLFAVAPA